MHGKLLAKYQTADFSPITMTSTPPGTGADRTTTMPIIGPGTGAGPSTGGTGTGTGTGLEGMDQARAIQLIIDASVNRALSTVIPGIMSSAVATGAPTAG